MKGGGSGGGEKHVVGGQVKDLKVHELEMVFFPFSFTLRCQYQSPFL